MLKVVRKSAWSYAFSVMDGTESLAQTVDLSWRRDEAELRLPDATYSARRQRSTYVLEAAGSVLARAERPRKLFRELIIEHAGHPYTLRAKSVFSREFLLFERATYLGSISPEGLFTRKSTVDLPKELPLYLQVFVMWLVMCFWKHADGAVASSAVAGVTIATG
jgi:hypothetical protein